ncbi:MAG: isoprenylcysteine carboxylmethyltransferase family protein [Desulfuromonadaceae bacterium]|nr:isoprenylcysteine carboxylmethyltransferase family protein [Desulfuromonadaceae bacterium]
MDSVILRSAIFVFIIFVFTVISRRALRNPRSHGFYRYFAFIGITSLLLYNQPVWFEQPFSGVHCLSWLLLGGSVALVLHGTVFLRRFGGQSNRPASPENLAFENTQHLVVNGLYRYIRHPMYASLLLLAWGAFLKRVDVLTIVVICVVTLAIYLTAKVEEQENIAFWGEDYVKYKLSSKMFIPFIL